MSSPQNLLILMLWCSTWKAKAKRKAWDSSILVGPKLWSKQMGAICERRPTISFSRLVCFVFWKGKGTKACSPLVNFYWGKLQWPGGMEASPVKRQVQWKGKSSESTCRPTSFATFPKGRLHVGTIHYRLPLNCGASRWVQSGKWQVLWK